ncbi:MAG: hypothetical protein IPH62_16475 [Ignavibacteriae bacterium]|nr:hypothetical protein [Ignavibacteriota bacterium]
MQTAIFRITFFLLLLFNTIISQQNNYLFEKLEVKDGLSNNSVNCIFQDRQGFLWVGTEYGLNRYDGYNFTQFIHNPNDSNSIGGFNIRDIEEDNVGNLWISTGNTLSLLAKENKFLGKFENFNQPTIWSIKQSKIFPDSIIWIPSKNGLKIFNKKRKTFSTFLLEENDSSYFRTDFLYSVLEDKFGRIWLTSANYKLTCITNPLSEKKIIKSFPDILKYTDKDFAYYSIFKFLEDSKSNIWIGSYGAGLIKIPAGKLNVKEFDYYHTDAELKNKVECNLISNSIIEDDEGIIWVSTDCNGIMKIDTETNKINYIKDDPTKQNRLGSNRITCLFFDKEGILWAGTKDNGIVKIIKDTPSFKYFESRFDNRKFINRVKFNAWSIKKSRKENLYWVGIDEGLLLVEKKGDRLINTSEFIFNKTNNANLNNLQIRDIYEDEDNTLLLATIGLGMIKLNPQSGEYTILSAKRDDPYFPPSNNIYCIEHDDKFLWLGLNNGSLTSLDLISNKFKEYPLPNTKSEQHFITTIKKSKLIQNSLWIGEWNFGLILFNTQKKTFKFYHNNSKYSESINENCITALYEDENNVIWLGTYGGGLIKCILTEVKESVPSVEYKRYDTNFGLNNEMVYGILKDKTGNIWISTNFGISKFNMATESFTNYTSSEGLPKEAFNLGATLSDDGILFFGGSDGIYYFKPVENCKIAAPNVVLTEFKIFGKSANKQFLKNNGIIQLSHNDDFFSFEFAALSFKNPTKNQYAYIMEGFHNYWINIGDKREAVFMNMEPGNYKFKVKASNSDGIWTNKILSMEVNINSPFWKTWWFYFLNILAIMIILFMIHKAILYRTIKIREELKSNLARNFHDDTGGIIASLKINSYNLLKSENQNKQIMLQQINKQTTQLSRTIKDMLFEIDPDKSSLTNLVIYIKNFSDSLFENRGIIFQIEGLEDNYDKIILPSEWKMNLLAIFKEGINNIIKHASDCKNVILKVEAKSKRITIQLSDDGNGFDKSINYDGNGLKNMNFRASKLNSKLDIFSKKGIGTTISFNAKLP